MLRFATDGILSFSTKPLQLSIGLGIFSAFLALLGMLYAVLIRLFTDNWVEGWAAIMVAVLFIGGIQLISIGVVGEYVGRIYGEIKKRPLYIVSKYYGFDKSPPFMTRSPVVRLEPAKKGDGR
jgi:dolichol-phosphate mannosyltransferase